MAVKYFVEMKGNMFPRKGTRNPLFNVNTCVNQSLGLMEANTEIEGRVFG